MNPDDIEQGNKSGKGIFDDLSEKFNLESYLSALHDENGKSIPEEQKNQLRESIKKNGLGGFKNGMAVMVVQPEPIH